MLTADLARFEIVGNEIKPKYISRKEAPTYLPICSQIIEIYHRHVGKSRAELQSCLEQLESQADFKAVRGLVKLVDDLSTYSPATAGRPAASIDFQEFRGKIFESAQRYYPVVTKPDLLHSTSREQVVQSIANELTLSPEHIDSLLFADLPEHHILQQVNVPFTAEELLQRYNLALAQILLCYAAELTITVTSDYKLIWKYVKLARLIHEIQKIKDGYRVRLTGPVSVFRNSRKYGVRMAMFLPGLLLAQRFTMEAIVQMFNQQYIFRLNEQCGLRSLYRESRAEFDSSIEESFYQKFNSLKQNNWQIERETEIIDLGDTVLIPDFTFTHTSGKKAHLEIVGFWTPEYIHKKFEKLQRATVHNLIVALGSSLNCSRESLAKLKHAHIVFFKGKLKTTEVQSLLDQIAIDHKLPM